LFFHSSFDYVEYIDKISRILKAKVGVNNKSLNIHFFQSFQNRDMDFLGRILSQNKICRVVNISGGNWIGQGKDFSSCFKNSQEPITLTIKYSNNIEFLYDLLKEKSSVQHLKLSFWSSSSTILSRFCEALAKTSTLTELSITGDQCFDNDDFTECAKNKQIEELRR